MKTPTMEKLNQLQIEMSRRRRELINKEKRFGGTVSIKLKTDNLEYFYRKNREPEPFFICSRYRGLAWWINESNILLGW